MIEYKICMIFVNFSLIILEKCESEDFFLVLRMNLK
jgi:hypothetical protein